MYLCVVCVLIYLYIRMFDCARVCSKSNASVLNTNLVHVSRKLCPQVFVIATMLHVANRVLRVVEYAYFSSKSCAPSSGVRLL